AQQAGAAWILNGAMPWVTGAPRADYFLTGAVLEDDRQVLLVVPRQLPGVSVTPSLDLMALRGSLTAEVQCADVKVDEQWVLAGPAQQILARGRGGTGGLETSCLALGLAGAAINYLGIEAEKRT